MYYNLILLKLSKFKIVLIFRQRVEMREIIDHRGRICASLYTSIKNHLLMSRKNQCHSDVSTFLFIGPPCSLSVLLNYKDTIYHYRPNVSLCYWIIWWTRISRKVGFEQLPVVLRAGWNSEYGSILALIRRVYCFALMYSMRIWVELLTTFYSCTYIIGLEF